MLPVWRSLLVVPVGVPRFLEKAHAHGADGIVLDLEDSVPPEQKATARAQVPDAVRSVARGGADVLVRVNQPLELCVRDLETVVSPEVAGVVLPKVDSAGHIRLLAELVSRIERQKGMADGHTSFSLLVETADAFGRTEEIANAHPRNVAISLGVEDFSLSLQVAADPEVLLFPMQRIIIAARAAGILPLGVIGSMGDYRDEARYRAAVRHSRRFGFVGAGCIHPSNVAILNEEFRPTRDELAAARRIVDGFEAARREGRGSVAIDGRMVDPPIALVAQRLLDAEARIRKREARRAPASDGPPLSATGPSPRRAERLPEVQR
jgi:citrate lyase subunit beta/citryl-CoA lyase